MPDPKPEPEIRRAEPVQSGRSDAQAAVDAHRSADAVGRAESLRHSSAEENYVRVTSKRRRTLPLSAGSNVTERPMQFRGKRIAVKVLDPDGVEIRKNGKVDRARRRRRHA